MSEYCPSQGTTSTEHNNKPHRKRAALDTFLETSDQSPIKKTMCKEWVEAHASTTSYYTKKCTGILNAVCTTLAPGQEVELLQSVVKSAALRKMLDMDHNTGSHEILECLCQLYKLAETPSIRKKVLSIIAPNYEYFEVKEILDISRYQFNTALKYASYCSPGYGLHMRQQDDVRHRQTITDAQHDHFIDFILSPQVSIDCPFGSTKMSTETGIEVVVPVVIMKHHKSEVVRQYMAYCDESEFKPCSESSCMRILADIRPKMRKSMHGLDNYHADGMDGFDTLKKLATEIFIINHTEIVKKLERGQRYLKCEYAVSKKSLMYNSVYANCKKANPMF